MARTKLRLTSQEIPSQLSSEVFFEQTLRSHLSPNGWAAWEAYKASHSQVWTSLGILSKVDIERDLDRLIAFFEPSSN